MQFNVQLFGPFSRDLAGAATVALAMDESERDDRGDEGRDEGLRDRISARSETALVDIAQVLLDSPLLHQAFEVAIDARDRATQASASAMRGLNVPQASDVDRLGRRLRAVSERLESLEDAIDQLAREVAELRRGSGSARGPGG
jgi:hypothetical protein